MKNLKLIQMQSQPVPFSFSSKLNERFTSFSKFLKNSELLPQKTLRLNSPRKNRLSRMSGGDKRDRTVDPLLAKQVLSQLSYAPVPLTASGGS